MVEIKVAARRFGTLALAALLVVSMVGASGLATAKTGMDGDDGDDSDDGMDGDAVFSEEITLSIAGVTITLGPPTDPNDDGVYEDVTGDGEVNVIDAVAHAAVVTAVDRGLLDLNKEQANALDVDRDGDVDIDDALALARTTLPGAMG
jgi:hypothetical protein